MELNGNILKLFEKNSNVLAVAIETLEPIFEKIWVNAINKTKNENEILYCVCFYDDLLKYVPIENFNRIVTKFFELSQKYNTTNQDIVQSVIWGFGELAKRLDKNLFSQYKETVINSINFIISKSDANSEDNCFTTDNAVSSLAKYVYFQCNEDNTGLELTSKLLDLLPLKSDVTEGCEVLKLFFTQILNKNRLILNTVFSKKLSDAFSRIQEIRTKDGEFLDDEGLALYIQTIQSLGFTI